MNIAAAVAFVGLIVFLAHLFSAIFSRTRIPDVLFLILIGLGLGPISGLLGPADLGRVGPVFTTVTLVTILFEGGLGLDLRQLGRALTGTAAVTVLSFVATMFVVGLVSWLALDLPLQQALLVGAIIGGTSSAVVIPIVRRLRMGESARTVLFMESALSDVLCIVVSLALIDMILAGTVDLTATAGQMLASFLLAGVLGVAAGVVWSGLLAKVRTLENAIFTTPAFVFVVYGLVELLGYSGAIAALAFGVTLGNLGKSDASILRRLMPQGPAKLSDTERVFFSEIVFLLKTFFFMLIGISMRFDDLPAIAFAVFVTALVFTIRIPVVVAALPRSVPKSDAAVCAIMVPKGLAAAALATLPVQAGIQGGTTIQNLTYGVVLFSIVATSVLVFLLDRTPLGRWYGAFFPRHPDEAEPPFEATVPVPAAAGTAPAPVLGEPAPAPVPSIAVDERAAATPDAESAAERTEKPDEAA